MVLAHQLCGLLNRGVALNDNHFAAANFSYRHDPSLPVKYQFKGCNGALQFVLRQHHYTIRNFIGSAAMRRKHGKRNDSPEDIFHLADAATLGTAKSTAGAREISFSFSSVKDGFTV